MHKHLARVRLAIVAASLLFASFATTSAQAQNSYSIGPGDVVSVQFLSNPRLDRRMTVGADGNIFVPLIGQIPVENLTSDELQEQLPVLLTGAVYRERIQGEYLLVAVEPEDVIFEVTQYRPIFVDGAVQAPGQQDFVIGITVRQAIAAASGLETFEQKYGLSAGELRLHPDVLMSQLVGVMAEIAVQRAILDGSTEIDQSELDTLNAPRDQVDDAISLAMEQAALSGRILTEEASFFKRSVKESEARVIAALRREEAMVEILMGEEAEVARLEDLFERRLTTSDQLTAVRRNYLVVTQRAGDIQAERLQAESQLRELVLRQNQSARERSLQIQERLGELSRQASQYRTQIALGSGAPSAVDASTVRAGATLLTIFRSNGGRIEELVAYPETLLQPGDVLNVAVGN
ncbi:MAG: polysaccharide biosynthesis/export family protein [Pseudomonadota bacterium]